MIEPEVWLISMFGWSQSCTWCTHMFFKMRSRTWGKLSQTYIIQRSKTEIVDDKITYQFISYYATVAGLKRSRYIYNFKKIALETMDRLKYMWKYAGKMNKYILYISTVCSVLKISNRSMHEAFHQLKIINISLVRRIGLRTK